MAVYGLAILWPAGAPADRAAEVTASMKASFPANKVELIQVARLGNAANLHVRLNLSPYPRPTVEKLISAVDQAQGRLVELWRMSKHERDSFRAAHLGGQESTATYPDFEAAGREVRAHLTRLPKPTASKKPAIALGPSEPAAAPPSAPLPSPVPTPAAPPVPEAAPAATSPPQRRWERLNCHLEVEFKTEYDFVLEHATNICNGGVFVKTTEPPELNAEVSLKIRLPDGRLLESIARVAHVVTGTANAGVGLEFLRDDETFTRALDEYLQSLR